MIAALTNAAGGIIVCLEPHNYDALQVLIPVFSMPVCHNICMKSVLQKGNIPLVALAISAAGALSILGFLVVPVVMEPEADMYLETRTEVVPLGEKTIVTIYVKSSIPVNVFAGEVLFDPAILQVDSISYNTSIADLWAEKPWHSNGAGTINFGGGTTAKGGFLGKGILMTITFNAEREGATRLALRDPRILLHDGLGTDVDVAQPIDTIITVSSENKIARTVRDTPVTVFETRPSTDLNGDGRQTIVDVSIFLINGFRYNERFDFNLDSSVDLKDLSILMEA